MYQLGLKTRIEEASSSMRGLQLWRVYHEGNDAPEGRVEEAEKCKFKHFGRAEHTSWSTELETDMRLMERSKLMELLNQKVNEVGGEIQWGKKLKGLEALERGRTKAIFEDNNTVDLDLVVGAEGTWSLVRRHILNARYGQQEAEKKWIPEFQKASNIYGISALSKCALPEAEIPKYALEDTHGCWLDRGHLTTSTLPGGVIRWDLQLAEIEDPPPLSTSRPSPASGIQPEEEQEKWISKISAGAYPNERTVQLLKKHASAYHPVTGTFGRMLAASTRIFHSPLRQTAWGEKEIQSGNVVCIGDAAKVAMPSSGQGTSFAIEDATVLADCLLQFPLEEGSGGEDGGKGVGGGDKRALQEYAKRRVKRNKQVTQYATAGCEVGLGRTWYWRWTREVSSMLFEWSNNM
jgi:2-polyprenyl-6-methoxyphenol hydroxylase-like FAD-dependent oxidoreductase